MRAERTAPGPALHSEKIYADTEGAIGWIVFNQPEKRNAMSLSMWQALPGLIQQHADDPAVRVIMLRGAGRDVFASGADISEFEKLRADVEQSNIYNATTERANEAIATADKPTVAMIYGICFGGGMGIASSCDLRIASDDARFRIPAARLGLTYGVEGVRHLITLVGAAATREIFLTAAVYGADEMLRMGYLNRVFSAADLESEARDYAEQIAANAPLTLRSIKISVREGVKDRADRDMALVDEAARICFGSKDYEEGRRAFMEKRKPEFRGE